MILRYHLQLTTYDGRRVIVSTSVESTTFLDDLDSSELREFKHKCDSCSVYKDLVVLVVLPLYTSIYRIAGNFSSGANFHIFRMLTPYSKIKTVKIERHGAAA